MDAAGPRTCRTGLAGAAERVIVAWAVLGGSVVLMVVAVNVLTVVGNIVGLPFPGDFELTQMGIAVAAFAFLPYCQLTGANVTADIFTARAGRRWIAAFALAASIVALLFAIVMTRQTYEGMSSQQEYGYITAILQVPIWWAYVPAVVSVALLIIAALITLIESFGAVVQPDPAPDA